MALNWRWQYGQEEQEQQQLQGGGRQEEEKNKGKCSEVWKRGEGMTGSNCYPLRVMDCFVLPFKAVLSCIEWKIIE